ncbi:MAG: phage portal protein [Pseudomonadota bacterium]
MAWWQRKEERSQTIAQSATAADWYAFFGIKDTQLPTVTVDAALKVPAVSAAVKRLSETLAACHIGLYRRSGMAVTPVSGTLNTMLADAPNETQTSFKFRRYLWRQVFTHGRGMAYIERNANGTPRSLFGLDVTKVTVHRQDERLHYTYGRRRYEASDVIDITWADKDDMTGALSPIIENRRAIALAIAMNDYAAHYFAGGGVPPLSLEGPMPTGAEAMKRQMEDIMRAINTAKDSNQPVFPMPPGHALKPVGLDPDKGQMVAALEFQIEEIARGFGIPPVFLQDLRRGTYSNTEQQDLSYVKHTITPWAEDLEEELNLKFFGRSSRSRFYMHDLESISRGDTRTRTESNERAIFSGQKTVNEIRTKQGDPAVDGGDQPLVQSAMIPLNQVSNQNEQ